MPLASPPPVWIKLLIFQVSAEVSASSLESKPLFKQLGADLYRRPTLSCFCICYFNTKCVFGKNNNNEILCHFHSSYRFSLKFLFFFFSNLLFTAKPKENTEEWSQQFWCRFSFSVTTRLWKETEEQHKPCTFMPLLHLLCRLSLSLPRQLKTQTTLRAWSALSPNRKTNLAKEWQGCIALSYLDPSWSLSHFSSSSKSLKHLKLEGTKK